MRLLLHNKLVFLDKIPEKTQKLGEKLTLPEYLRVVSSKVLQKKSLPDDIIVLQALTT